MFDIDISTFWKYRIVNIEKKLTLTFQHFDVIIILLTYLTHFILSLMSPEDANKDLSHKIHNCQSVKMFKSTKQILAFRHFGILAFCIFAFLTFWHFHTPTFQNYDNSTFWHFDILTLTFWHFNISTLRNDEIPIFQLLTFWHFDIWTLRHFDDITTFQRHYNISTTFRRHFDISTTLRH